MRSYERTSVFGHLGDWIRPRLYFSGTTRSWLALFCLMSIIRSARAEDPQTLSETQIKAGFVFNFTRFVEWPESAFATSTSPFMVCVVGAAPIAELLTETSVGKAVDGRPLTIKSMKPTDDLRVCHVLYLGAAGERQEIRVLEMLKGSSVLTVSEIQKFALAGGMIGFVVQENKVKLEINLEAATHAGLKVSSKLIAVSRLVSRSSALGGN